MGGQRGEAGPTNQSPNTKVREVCRRRLPNGYVELILIGAFAGRAFLSIFASVRCPCCQEQRSDGYEETDHRSSSTADTSLQRLPFK